jgi:4'-phosphopantetheinyl transferase
VACARSCWDWSGSLKNSPMTLFPVILPVAEDIDELPQGKQTAFLSRVSRDALRLSAHKSGITLGQLSQDENGAPLPFDNHYWSVSHKPRYVAAVVSADRVGIDIEEVKPRSESVLSYVATEEEWKLCGGKSWDTFPRYWTAKEAVLKAVGIGLGGLKTCQVISVPDETNVVLQYRDCVYHVEQLRYSNHIVSVLKDDNRVEWITPKQANRQAVQYLS